jgi:hypothetical protein
MIHENSLEAYHEEKPKLTKREREILDFLEARPFECFTVRQIQRKLGYRERADVQPRCSDLLRKGLIEEYGKASCDVTGKPVAKLGLVIKETKQMEMFA